MTPSQARNAVKRCLKEIIDPNPTEKEIEELWTYFGNQCCFCGEQIEIEDRKGHLDHLIPDSQGGKNFIKNRVLACYKCNGDEKLESKWEDFLGKTCGNNTKVFEERKNRIGNWIRNENLVLSDQDKLSIEKCTEEVNQILSKYIQILREKKLNAL
jgi:hypothetical protein